MKKKITLGLLTTSVLVAVMYLYYVRTDSKGGFGAPMSAGGEEDISERIRWEIDRLKDPATGVIPEGIRKKELAYAATLPGYATGADAKNATIGTWDIRGPWNVGGRTRAFAVDISNENVLLAGGTSGGMWRSTDQGASWTQTTAISALQSVSCLAQDKRAGKTNIWYYGSGEGYGTSASGAGAFYLGDGLFKSTDGGVTWSPLAATATGNANSFTTNWQIIWNVATDPSNTTQDVLYAATYGAIYRSSNGGTNWTAVKTSSNNPYFTDVQVSATGVVYATVSSDGGTAKGIWRSTDGVTFTNITPATGFPAEYNRIVIGISPSDENQVYFLGNTPNAGTPDTNFVGEIEWNSLWKYTYVSGNGTGTGGVWEDRSANLPTTGGLFDKFSAQGSYNLVVEVKPDDANTVFIGGTNLYRSTNGFSDNTQTAFIGGYEQGATLPVVNMYDNHHPDQHVVDFLPSNPNVLFNANDGGVFSTDNCMAGTVVWNSLNNGYLTTNFYTVAIDHATTSDIVVAGAQDNGSWFTNSTNPTTPWVTPRGGDGSYCAVADSSKDYYLSIQNGKMMRARLDANGTVTDFARIDPIGGRDYQFINPYILDPNNNNMMYLAGGKRIWRNNDLSGIPYASNWDTISTNWTAFPDTLTSGRISALAVSKSNPANVLYYGSTAKKVYKVVDAHNSSTRVDITSTLFPNANVSCIAVDPLNGNNVMVSFSNYSVYSIFYTTDGGTTWSKSAGNLEVTSTGTGNGPSIKWLSIMPVSDGKVYLAATSTGIYATDTLKGLNTVWVQQGAANIGNAVCDMIDYRTTDGLVVVATHAHGLYSTHITSKNQVLGNSKQKMSNLTSDVSIYPNPMNATAKVNFDLKISQELELTLLDQRGSVVYTIAKKMYKIGANSEFIDKGSIASGLYYVNIKGEGININRKLIIN